MNAMINATKFFLALVVRHMINNEATCTATELVLDVNDFIRHIRDFHGAPGSLLQNQ